MMRRNCRSTRSSGRTGFLVAAAAVAAWGASGRAIAQLPTFVTWVGTTGDYNAGANWSSGVTPTNAANEFLTIGTADGVHTSGTAQVSADGQGAFLNLGMLPGTTGALQITGGTLSLGELRVGGRENAPDATGVSVVPNGGGTGSVTQSGTSVVNVTFDAGSADNTPVQSTYIGDSGLASGNTANGSYLIKDSAVLNNGINTSDQLVIGTGVGAHGTFTQEGNSTVTSAGTLIVARRGATGFYAISGGTLAPASALHIADAETPEGAAAGTVGSFTQTGGVVNTSTTGSSEWGRKGGTGTYSISGGTLNLGHQLNLGSAATTGSPAVPVPGEQNSVGIWNVSGTAEVTTTAGRNIFIGFNNAQTTYQSEITSSAIMNMSGGTVTLSNTLFIIASGSGVTGTVNLTGGTIQPASGVNNLEIDIGRSAGNGTLNVSGTGAIRGNNMLVGGNTNPIGNDGTLNVSENGSVSLSGNLTLSASVVSGASPVRTINIDGGTVIVNNLGATATVPASPIARTFNMTNGSLSVAGTVTGGNAVAWNFGGGSVTIGNFNSTNNSGGATTISGGTFNCVGNFRVMNGTPDTAGSLTITGGDVTMGALFSGGSVSLPSVISISGGNLSIGPITFNSGATLRTDNNISLSSAITPGDITIDTHSGSLVLSGALAIPANGRTITKAGAGTLDLNGAWNHNANPGTSNLNATDGTTNVNVDLGAPTNVNASAGATVNLGVSQAVRDVVTTGGTVALTAGGNKVLTANSATVSGGGKIDLANNSMLVNSASTSASTVRGYLQSAFNGGAWNGSGITSSTARDRVDNATGLGYVDLGAEIKVVYTWTGDLNLDGKVNGDDYVLIDRQVAKNGANAAGFWTDGDVNYNGTVGTDDYQLIDLAYAKASTGGVLSAEFLAMREAQFGPDYVSQLVAAVPEPGCGLVLAAFGLFGMRTRKRSRTL